MSLEFIAQWLVSITVFGSSGISWQF